MRRITLARLPKRADVDVVVAEAAGPRVPFRAPGWKEAFEWMGAYLGIPNICAGNLDVIAIDGEPAQIIFKQEEPPKGSVTVTVARGWQQIARVVSPDWRGAIRSTISLLNSEDV